jgi:hypothetical protein
VPFATLLRGAELAQVIPSALEHVTVIALTGGVLHPVNFGVTAFTWTVKEEGFPVVWKTTIVVEGAPVTLPSGLFEVNVTELGVTKLLLTFAWRGNRPTVRSATAIRANRLRHILGFDTFWWRMAITDSPF